MAVLTDIRRLNMITGLAERIDVVVAADAVSGDVGVVEVRRNPAARRVAVVTGIAASDMVRALAHGNRAVVTRAACAEHLQVIDAHYGRERYDAMAILAEVRRLYVRDGLADRIDVVVAAHAIGSDVVVIEIGRCPGSRRMAVVASVATDDVAGVLAHRCRAVVTGATGSEHLRVIDLHDGCECDDAMTVFADARCRNVRRRLADCSDSVVAACAISRDVIVVEIRRRPRGRTMTVLARVAAEDVACVLSGGDNAVVT